MSEQQIDQGATPNETPQGGNPIQLNKGTSHEATPEAKAPPQKAEAPKAPEYFEAVIDGKTQKVTKEELIRSYQMSKAAHERFETAAQKERKANQIIEQAKGNPIQALSDAGLSRDQIKEAMEKWYHQEFIETEGMSKEQLEWREEKKELEALREEKKLAAQKKLEAEQEQETTIHREKLQQDIIKSIDEFKLPKTPYTVSRFAYHMNQALRNGLDLPMPVIAQKVANEARAIARSFSDEPDLSRLEDIYGTDFLDRLLKDRLDKIKKSREGNSNPIQQLKPRDSDGNKISFDEMEKRLNKMRF